LQETQEFYSIGKYDLLQQTIAIIVETAREKAQRTVTMDWMMDNMDVQVIVLVEL